MLHYKRMLKATLLPRLQVTLLFIFLLKAFDEAPFPWPIIFHLALAKLLWYSPLAFVLQNLSVSHNGYQPRNYWPQSPSNSGLMPLIQRQPSSLTGNVQKLHSCIWGGRCRERKNKAPLTETPITPEAPLHAGLWTPQAKSFMWGGAKRRQQIGILPPGPRDASTSLITAFFW